MNHFNLLGQRLISQRPWAGRGAALLPVVVAAGGGGVRSPQSRILRYASALSLVMPKAAAIEATASTTESVNKRTELTSGVMDCGGKAGAATPLFGRREDSRLRTPFARAKAAWRCASRRSPRRRPDPWPKPPSVSRFKFGMRSTRKRWAVFKPPACARVQRTGAAHLTVSRKCAVAARAGRWARVC